MSVETRTLSSRAGHRLAAVCILCASCVLLATPGARASEGDDAPLFRGCVDHCTWNDAGAELSLAKYLDPEAASVPRVPRSLLCSSDAAGSAPLALRATRWTCEADCRYQCMWAIEDWRHQPRAGARNRATTLPYAPIKYFGKWPFRRVLGAQEPASVLFSLLNLAAQLWWGAWYRRRARRGAEAPSRGRFLTQRQVLAQCALSCNAWLWSAVFHTRDTPFTERADYFAAGLLVVASSYVCLARVFRLSPRVRAGLLTLLLGEYARRVRSMLLLRFDYGRWVAACVAAGGLQTLCWSWWLGWGRRAEGVEGVEREEGTEGALGAEIASQAASATAAGARRLALFVVLLNAASAFEIADFPPLAAALDAHAAWHLATVPLWGLWYRFAWADHASCRSAAQTGQLKQS